VLELGGVRDVLTKSIGTQNPINLVKATMDGLIRLRRPEEVAELRGLTVKQVLGLTTEKGTEDGEHLEPIAADESAPAAGPVADEASSSSQAAGEDAPSTPSAAEAAPTEAAAPAATEAPAAEAPATEEASS
jgi:small subunit ribosomal protein S5